MSLSASRQNVEVEGQTETVDTAHTEDVEGASNPYEALSLEQIRRIMLHCGAIASHYCRRLILVIEPCAIFPQRE